MKKFLLPVLILLTGCASLPLVESQDLNDPSSRAKYMYDLESNIAYKVQHDEEYLYVEFKTDDEMNIQKIFRNGLFVYVDPNAGKSKDIFFNYPLKSKPGRGEMKKMMQNMMQEKTDRQFDVAGLLESCDVEAIFSKDNMAEMIPVFARSNGFKVELSAPASNEFLYKLRIPMNEVLGKTTSEQEISLGIMSGEFEMPSRQGGGPSSGGGRPQGGMSSGGGMQSGGGMPSGGGHGGQGGDMSTSDNFTKMKEQISIWFKIAL